MQAVYTGSLADDGARASAASSSHVDVDSLQLAELALTISPQSLAHAPLFYDKAARLLSSRGLLVHANHNTQVLLVLVPTALNNDKGIKSVLSWLLPLLPSAPPVLKKHAKAAAPWSCLLRGVDHDGEGAALGGRVAVHIGQPDHWRIEMQPFKNKQAASGPEDAVVQACIWHAVRLELNRQGWSLVGGRFLRIPSGCTPSSSVPAVQLTLTISQQRAISVHLHVTHVRFNAIHIKSSAAASDLHLAESVVRVMPELDESQIVQVTGIAEPGRSLGVDREMWLERHGIVLPPSFPVVQVQMGVNDAFGNHPVLTYPLCCCLTSGLTEVNPRSRDEAAKQRLQQEQTATLQEIVTILKGVRVLAPSTGALEPLIRSLEQRDSDPLLQLLNGKSSAADTISTAIGFQKASSLTHVDASAGSAAAGGVKRKAFIALTIPRSKKARAANGSSSGGPANGSGDDAGPTLSLAFVKSTTQLPAPSVSVASNFASSWGAASKPSASSSSRHDAAAIGGRKAAGAEAEKKEASKEPSVPKRQKTSTPAGSIPTAPAGKKTATAAATSSKPATATAATAKDKSKSKEPTKSSAAPAPSKRKSAKETEAERAARKEQEKAARAAAKAAAKAQAKAAKAAEAEAAGGGGKASKKSSKSKSSAAASTGWGADFAAAFAAELSKPPTEVDGVAAEFRRAMGEGNTDPAPAPTPKRVVQPARVSSTSTATAGDKATAKGKKLTAMQTTLDAAFK